MCDSRNVCIIDWVPNRICTVRDWKMNDIQLPLKLLLGVIYYINHIFREANQVVDLLAKFGARGSQEKFFRF